MKLKIKSADAEVPEQEITATDGETVAISPGDTVTFPDGNPLAAVPQGSDLVVYFADGSSVVLEGFFAFEEGDDPPEIYLGEDQAFSADYGYQANDGPIVIIFSPDFIDSSVGYEPFTLAELETIGGLDGLVTLGVADFLELRDLGALISDVGEVPPIAGPSCIDGGTFSGSGFVGGSDCNDNVIGLTEAGNTLSGFGGNDTLRIAGVLDVLNNVLIGGAGDDSLFLSSDTEDVDFNLLLGGPGAGADVFRLTALATDGDLRSNTLIGGDGDDAAIAIADDDFRDNVVNFGGGDDNVDIFADDVVSNTILLAGGDDRVVANADEETRSNFFSGGAGSDVLGTYTDDNVIGNTLDGGDGIDRLFASSRLLTVDSNTFLGGAGPDDFFVFAVGDTLGDGDVLRNMFDGGEGGDFIAVGRDAVRLALDGGLAPDDPSIGSLGDDVSGNIIDGGDGDFSDTLFLRAADDAYSNVFRGNGGADSLRAVTLDDFGSNSLFGGDGGDFIRADAGDPRNSLSTGGDNIGNLFDGGLGTDFIVARSTDDDVASNRLLGGDGMSADVLRVTAFDEVLGNTLIGGDGNDSLVADSGGDNSFNNLSGEGGEDTLGLLTFEQDGDVRSNVLNGGAEGDLLAVEVRTELGLADIEFNSLFGEGGNDLLYLDVGFDQAVQNALGLNVFDGGGHSFSSPAPSDGGETSEAVVGLVGGDTLRIADGGRIESSGQVANIEILDIDNVLANDVNLDPKEVAAMTAGGGDTLRIVGNGGTDSICINFRDWVEVLAGSEPGFRLFQDLDGAGTFLEVQEDLLFSTVSEGFFNTLRSGDDLLLVGMDDPANMLFFNDTLAIDGTGASANTLSGGDGSDSLAIAGTSTLQLNLLVGDEDGAGCAGNDTLALTGSALMIDNVLEGGDGNDSITVASTANSVGRNALEGDDIYGNDTLVLRAEADFRTLYDNIVDGGDGRDSLLAMTSGSLGNAFRNSLDGGDGNDRIQLVATGPDSRLLNNSIVGDDGADSLRLETTADLEDNIVNGDAGADVLRGTAGTFVRGNDFDGGAGTDRDQLFLNAGTFASGNNLNGGEGGDSLVIEAVLGDVSTNVLLGGGTSAIDSNLANADRDNLVARAQAGDALSNALDGGTGGDSVLVDAVAGNASMNSLTGGVAAGADLEIRAGDQDTLFVRAGGDATGNRLDAGFGADSLLVRGGVAGPGEVSGNRLEGDGGNDNLGLIANSAAVDNILLGGDGNDRIRFEVDTAVQSVQETLDRNTLDGGTSDPGFGDTLRIDGGGEITSPGRVTGIEVLDIANGNSNLVSLDTMEVASMTSPITITPEVGPPTTLNALTILGDGPGDSVVIDPAQWTPGPVPIPGFNEFRDIGGTGVILRVDANLTISAPVAPSPAPLASEGDSEESAEAASYDGELSLEIDFEALAWQDGSLSGGEAGGLESTGGGDAEILVGAEEVLDFAGSEYAGAFASVDAGGNWAGGNNARNAAVVAAAAPEIALPHGAGAPGTLGLDVVPDDGLGVL